MPLDKYNKMRDFSKTREPRGARAKRHRDPIFVIQEHHATRLHYDFRLEAEGVLKSWAVTKEPSMDSSVKRLAIEVEDHPLPYAKFEGIIPKGEYGGGRVKIWDHGTYESITDKSLVDAIEEGHVKIRLHGRKLKGVFNLVRMRDQKGKPQWLLIKAKQTITGLKLAKAA